MVVPRPYQAEANDAVFRELADKQSTLVVMPTGTGKTVLFSSVAKRWQNRRILMLAHREELVFQMARTVEKVTGEKPGIEMADLRSNESGGIFSDNKPRVVVGSVQTLCRESRLRKFNPEEFGLGVVDEAHHDTPQCSTYNTVRSYFNQSKWLGVTATPDRTDKLALGQSYESVAYTLELEDAISNGWLCPIRQGFATVGELDFSHCRTTAGDLNQGDLDEAMSKPEVCQKVAAAILETCYGKKTLVFCVSVKHARIVCDILNAMPGIRAASLCGEDDRHTRRTVLRHFKSGEINCLVGCAIFTEGFDEPSIESVVIARPTKSRALYTQMVGRGTRTLEGLLQPSMNGADASVRLEAIANSAKPFVNVIDMVGNSGRHQLVTVADILGGRFAPAVKAKAIENIKSRGGCAADMQKELNAAKEQLDREEEAKRIKEANEKARREAEDRLRSAGNGSGVYGKAKVHVREIDPFGGGSTPNRGGYQRSSLSDKQRGILERNGYDPDRLTVQEGQRILNELFASWNGKGISPKQRETLTKHGEVGDISKAKCEVLFAVLKARNWQKRDYKLTRDRVKIVGTEGGYRLQVNDSKAGGVNLDKVFPTPDKVREHYSTILETAA